MVITLGQQYNVGEKPTVILYTYINRHAGTPTKGKTKRYSFVRFRQFSQPTGLFGHTLPTDGVGAQKIICVQIFL